MASNEPEPAGGRKERALEEFRVYWVITRYLWLFLASFTAYRRLIVPVLYKSAVFGLLVVVFGVLEHLVMGWIHGHGALDGLREFAYTGAYEIAAHLLAMIVAFVPFFAFCELGRVMGMRKLAGLFIAWPQTGDADRARQGTGRQ